MSKATIDENDRMAITAMLSRATLQLCLDSADSSLAPALRRLDEQRDNLIGLWKRFRSLFMDSAIAFVVARILNDEDVQGDLRQHVLGVAETKLMVPSGIMKIFKSRDKILAVFKGMKTVTQGDLGLCKALMITGREPMENDPTEYAIMWKTGILEVPSPPAETQNTDVLRAMMSPAGVKRSLDSSSAVDDPPPKTRRVGKLAISEVKSAEEAENPEKPKNAKNAEKPKKAKKSKKSKNGANKNRLVVVNKSTIWEMLAPEKGMVTWAMTTAITYKDAKEMFMETGDLRYLAGMVVVWEGAKTLMIYKLTAKWKRQAMPHASSTTRGHMKVGKDTLPYMTASMLMEKLSASGVN